MHCIETAYELNGPIVLLHVLQHMLYILIVYKKRLMNYRFAPPQSIESLRHIQRLKKKKRLPTFVARMGCSFPCYHIATTQQTRSMLQNARSNLTAQPLYQLTETEAKIITVE